MTPEEFENRVLAWARRQPEIDALVQFGSRVQASEPADQLADWDYHVYSSRPEKFRCTEWLAEIAPPWCAMAERSPRGVVKVSAIFPGMIEADFIPLASWQMKLVYWGMAHPEWVGRMPLRLIRGIFETRTIMLNSAYRVLVGGQAWERRMAALQVQWPERRISRDELERHVAAFWQKAVWVAKKIVRPEPRSAQLWLHKLSGDHVYALLEEEGWLAGRKARPAALKAEKWLSEARLAQTDLSTSLDQRVLADALLGQIDLFEEVSSSVARARGFTLADHSGVSAWLRLVLGKIGRDS